MNDSITWQEFRERYEAEGAADLSRATFQLWTSAANRFEAVVIPERLDDVTPNALAQYEQAMRAQGRAVNTIRGSATRLQRAILWACNAGLIDGERFGLDGPPGSYWEWPRRQAGSWTAAYAAEDRAAWAAGVGV